MNVLVDYNLQKYAAILLGKIANDGWLDLMPIRFVFFQEIGLLPDSSDRTVWQFAQDGSLLRIIKWFC